MSLARKRESLKGRYALKSILNDSPTNQMSRILIAAASTGKPYAPSQPKLFCSISHSDGYAAAAVSAQRSIGIDIEKIKSRHPAFVRSISDAEEAEQLGLTYPSEIIPTVLWAIKEAAAKADERIYPLKEYTVSSIGQLFVQRSSSRWSVSVSILSRHVSAVALAI